MSSLNDLLASKNIRSALVVDDAFDKVPLASDLAWIDRQEWAQFFDDLTPEDKQKIADEYPAFHAQSGDELVGDDLFVSILWKIRDQLSFGTASVLFERYIADSNGANQQLNQLMTLLGSFSLKADFSGRNFEQAAASVDLIIIDLYLGSGQQESDMRTSIDGLARLSKKRKIAPPLVVLMSSSTRLEDNYAKFRDETGLFASGFRFIRKSDLAEPNSLERILHRLATYRDESLKLSAFVDTWQHALKRASVRTTDLLRTLDLSEFGQVYDLLLAEEKASIGSFFVDVVDRVLQHEVEAEDTIIDAAQRLNGVDFTSFPPRYIGASPDLQKFVFASTFQHRARLRLNGNSRSKVVFGDLLLSRGKADKAAALVAHRLEIHEGSVFAVMTPACSLQRGEAKRVLLLAGTIQSLTMKDWYIKDSPVRTPVMELADGSQNWIKWDLEHVETISHSHLEELLDDKGVLYVAGRLRDLYAVELQQKLLAHLGRVGVSAPMPAAFEVNITLAFPGTDEKVIYYSADGADSLRGIVYVGRKGDERQNHLSLTETTCHSICKALRKLIDDSRLHPEGRSALVKILEKEYDLLAMFERGMPLKAGMSQELLPVTFPKTDTTGSGKAMPAFYMTRVSQDGLMMHKAKYKISPVILIVSDAKDPGTLVDVGAEENEIDSQPAPQQAEDVMAESGSPEELPQDLRNSELTK
ncbi:hypothetical protein [Brevifollis gellanilyticus]|uniref:Response receiver domain-containing protein n=1 Tax=Brevifollis gellanilyticus TaxID=748831 RepID=A0A512MCK7_9BACT|nr:hypothetical protein [Brevifollis gellanilyticus]GEP44456.1 hypothetical protein BGE01nite_37470 [Brevifollis gellanilyticus]